MMVFVRAALLLVGIAWLIGAVWSPVPGSIVAVTFLLVTTSYGPFNRGAAYVRVLQAAPDSAWAWGVAVAAFAAGTGSYGARKGMR